MASISVSGWRGGLSPVPPPWQSCLWPAVVAAETHEGPAGGREKTSPGGRALGSGARIFSGVWFVLRGQVTAEAWNGAGQWARWGGGLAKGKKQRGGLESRATNSSARTEAWGGGQSWALMHRPQRPPALSSPGEGPRPRVTRAAGEHLQVGL